MMMVFHSVVPTLENQMAEMAFFYFLAFIMIGIVLCNIAVGVYRFIRFVIFGLDGAG